MIFKIIYYNEISIQFYKTALFSAVEKGNKEIVRLLLANDKIDIDRINI